MRWTNLKFSKNKVRKAGKILSSEKPSASDFLEAYEVLSNWRSAHAYPMNTIQIFLRQQARRIEKEAIVVQRLKRTPSIIGKLFREPNMDLDRMQDIAGCRAVLTSIEKTRKLEKRILDSRTRNTFHSKKDYIENPKNSGYRGIHLIYKYSGTKEDFNNLFVEIQLRSKIQHSWATAVEVVDTFTNQALKSNQGQEIWADFFRFASAEFSLLEKCPIDKTLESLDTKNELKRLLDELQVIPKLKAFSVTTRHLTKIPNNKNEYHILILNTKDASIALLTFPLSKLQEATEKYSALEVESKDDPTMNVVLVSSQSIRELRKAYPNYFADTREFIANIEKCITLK